MQVGLEAKRYAENTSLPLDQLEAKLVQAAGQDEPVDLWVLAATREITDTDARTLEKVGRSLGVIALILDWPRTPGSLPRLASACAAAPQVLQGAFGADPDLADALSAIAADPRFEAQRDGLIEELTRADIGFAAAAAAVADWNRRAQATETAARARLDGFNNLLDPAMIVAPRPTLDGTICSWWGGANRLGALVGEEGFGKTWAALAFGGADEAGEPPLKLFVSAKRAGGRLPARRGSPRCGGRQARRHGPAGKKQARAIRRRAPARRTESIRYGACTIAPLD